MILPAYIYVEILFLKLIFMLVFKLWNHCKNATLATNGKYFFEMAGEKGFGKK